ncbi:MAG: HEAT repeat domain-containing protein [Bacteroidota bacterium]|nr:HEAT repeat domain-containing protein [Bacteroidota bacterium]
MKFRLFILLLLVWKGASFAKLEVKKPRQEHATSFAIIIDKETYDNAENAVNAYRDAVENDGLSTYILISQWKTPDEIKAEILKLYNQKPQLEGVVFIGDIPIPMLRNAEHLTSSFKFEDESSSYFNSSVPSDRFYDDFHLKFKYIKQDYDNPLCYYYTLLPESPQKVNKNIYSARIKAPVNNASKYDMIKRYLERIVEQKKMQNVIDDMFVYTGFKYYSESLNAWGDEQLYLREQFPQLYRPGGRLKKLNHTMSQDMKGIILSEIQDPKLDIAIFHAHGDDDAQSLIDNTKFNNVDGSVSYIKAFLRKELRAAKRQGNSVEETKAELIKQYDVPEDWFDGAFSSSQIQSDSLMEYKTNIYGEDVRKISPQAKFILFDQCYNGSFQNSVYMAGDYVFGYGSKTIAGVANTTTTLQDQWAEENLGLLNYGVRFGQWHRMNNLLESHLFGDPTAHFSALNNQDLNRMLVLGERDTLYWRNMMKSEDIPLRSLATRMMFRIMNKDFEGELVNIYESENSFCLRLQAIEYLAELGTPTFQEILKESIQDPFEFIRRISAVWMGKVGKKEYLSIMARQLVTDESERVVFNLKKSIAFIDPVAAYEECVKYLNEMPEEIDKGSLKEMIRGSILSSSDRLNKELLPNIMNDSLRIRKKIKEIETLRVYNYIQAGPQLLQLAMNTKEDIAIRVATLEALGWYSLSYNKDAIVKACDELIGKTDTPQIVKDEALRTKNRIKEGFNNPVTS